MRHVVHILQKHSLRQDLMMDQTGDSQDISQVSSFTMSSRMQDVISQQAREKSREHILTTTRESGICTQILQQTDKSTLDSGSFDAEAELGMEEAVFYQNGDWEYAHLLLITRKDTQLNRKIFL